MKLQKLVRLTFLLVAVLVLAGCQQIVVSPPPEFEPPVVTPGVQQPPPPGSTITAKAPSGITPIQGDPLIAGAALQPKKPARAWKYIVVHHSDTPFGSALRFHKAHLARNWEGGLGYDFVIGNGSETADGLIEVGPRWTYQLDGAHTGTPDRRYNLYGIGICLVGNFEQTRPSAKQMDSLARLCAYLMKTYNIPASNILRHKDCKPTDCPGRYLDISQVRKLATGYTNR